MVEHHEVALLVSKGLSDEQGPRAGAHSGTFLRVATAMVTLVGLTACGPHSSPGPGPSDFKVVGLTPSSDPIIGGVNVEGTVTLDSSPCTSNVTVQLTGGTSVVTVPATVVVQANCGALQGVATFPITTRGVGGTSTSTIRAVVGAKRARIAAGAPPAAWAGYVLLGDGSARLRPRSTDRLPAALVGVCLLLLAGATLFLIRRDLARRASSR